MNNNNKINGTHNDDWWFAIHVDPLRDKSQTPWITNPLDRRGKRSESETVWIRLIWFLVGVYSCFFTSSSCTVRESVQGFHVRLQQTGKVWIYEGVGYKGMLLATRHNLLFLNQTTGTKLYYQKVCIRVIQILQLPCMAIVITVYDL